MSEFEVQSTVDWQVTSDPIIGLVMVTAEAVDGDNRARIVLGLTGPQADRLVAQIVEARAVLKP